jgi:solute carrier family 25 phosphate transporter 3
MNSIKKNFKLNGITIDVVKTKMQTDPEKYNKGVIQAAQDIIKLEGVSFLLSGLGILIYMRVCRFYPYNLHFVCTLATAPTVVGYGFEGALKFGFYETFKKLFVHLTPSKFINFLLASVIAGAIASVVLVIHFDIISIIFS